jgi:hypothetical protein
VVVGRTSRRGGDGPAEGVGVGSGGREGWQVEQCNWAKKCQVESGWNGQRNEVYDETLGVQKKMMATRAGKIPVNIAEAHQKNRLVVKITRCRFLGAPAVIFGGSGGL